MNCPHWAQLRSTFEVLLLLLLVILLLALVTTLVLLLLLLLSLLLYALLLLLFVDAKDDEARVELRELIASSMLLISYG